MVKPYLKVPRFPAYGNSSAGQCLLAFVDNCTFHTDDNGIIKSFELHKGDIFTQLVDANGERYKIEDMHVASVEEFMNAANARKCLFGVK